MQQQQQMVAKQELMKQAGQFANAPVMDPDKNPEAIETASDIANQAGIMGQDDQPTQPQ